MGIKKLRKPEVIYFKVKVDGKDGLVGGGLISKNLYTIISSECIIEHEEVLEVFLLTVNLSRFDCFLL